MGAGGGPGGKGRVCSREETGASAHTRKDETFGRLNSGGWGLGRGRARLREAPQSAGLLRGEGELRAAQGCPGALNLRRLLRRCVCMGGVCLERTCVVAGRPRRALGGVGACRQRARTGRAAKRAGLGPSRVRGLEADGVGRLLCQLGVDLGKDGAPQALLLAQHLLQVGLLPHAACGIARSAGQAGQAAG